MAADLERGPDPEALIETLTRENTLLSRRIERERRIRQKAEGIAEQGLRELYNQQRELEFLSEITTMANQAGSAREVLASALEYICRFTGWPAAHAFIVGGQGAARRMWPSNIWYGDPDLDLSGLRADTSECVFEEGVGLPGRVWESGKPVWMDDLVTCDYFARKGSALRSGLRSAFRVPGRDRIRGDGVARILRAQPDAGRLGPAEHDRQSGHAARPGDRAR